MESIYLSGSEDVQRAGRAISNAADTIRSASSQMDESLTRHRAAMDEFVTRFEQAVERLEKLHAESRD